MRSNYLQLDFITFLKQSTEFLMNSVEMIYKKFISVNEEIMKNTIFIIYVFVFVLCTVHLFKKF